VNLKNKYVFLNFDLRQKKRKYYHHTMVEFYSSRMCTRVWFRRASNLESNRVRTERNRFCFLM